MAARIIDGKQVAAGIRAELKDEVAKLKERGITPGLGVILVGDDPASVSYVTGKERACEEIGIYSYHNHLPAQTSQADLVKLIGKLNRDPKVNGILVQLPLPRHLKESEVIFAIDPSKDVDGIHPVSVGKMVTGEKAFLSCTPHGVLQLLLRSGVKIEGSHVVIVGRSNLVGRPLANMLIQKSPTGNATVTVCHTRTKDLAHHTRQADILVAAAGQPKTITADMVREGAVVIDVGVTRVDDSTKKAGFRLVGDVDFDAVKEKASLITPVPGGVGPMTITMLLYNTVESAKRAAGLV
ncbi:MAG: bifunctional methylenetetrahydrofolate dehydrogenase/methenyltetrahydrofolate cyclohydrolase FolD [Phycisphaerales bacterium]